MYTYYSILLTTKIFIHFTSHIPMATTAFTTWSNNWMAGILDGTPISAISIPGTHDSCARFEYELVRTRCQWFSVTQQLNRGIRFLDIRCRYEADSQSGRSQGIFFPIHHAATFQNIFFEEVQAQCIAFLTQNPTEFILMNIQMEYDCTNNDQGCGDQFRKKFLELTAPYQAQYWYMKNSIPKIEDCRGRIVLIRAYDPTPHATKGWGRGADAEWTDGAQGGGLEWNGFNHDGLSHNAVFRTQNGWQKWSGTDKGNEVESYIKHAPQNATNGHITLNFASYASDEGPGPNAAGMNPRLQTFLRNYRPNNHWATVLGIIPIDFTGNTGDGGDSLENLIIEHQLHQNPQATYAGLPVWLEAMYR
jgi:1-phosphatidylinositol phosphodiesterase